MTKADSRDEILALAAKVEQATEPESIEATYLERDIYRIAANNPEAELLDAPRYLSSLDAAMSLVPEGPEWSAGRTHDGKGIATVWTAADECQCEAATPALALTASALRAHAAKENDDD